MRIAHMADIHLGYRALRKVRNGVNVRELDVAKAWRRTVRGVMDEQPDLILVAGDLFHSIRPSWHTFTEAVKGLREMADVAPIVVIGGNHDTPRTVETGSPIAALEHATRGTLHPVHTAPDRAQVIHTGFADVVAWPYWAVANRAGRELYLESRPDGIPFICVAHAAVDTLPFATGRGSVSVEDLRCDLYDYVALGDYHDVASIAGNAHYSGAIERTTSNIWAESREKGWLLVDTCSLEDPVHIVDPTIRPVRVLNATEELWADSAIADFMDESPPEAMVRITLRYDYSRDLMHEVQREHGDKVFHLMVRRAPRPMTKPDGSAFEHPAFKPVKSLEEELREVLIRRALEQSGTAPDDELLALGDRYLSEAADQLTQGG